MTCNLDSTGEHIIRKGMLVARPKEPGVRGQVQRSSRGSCLVLWPGQRYTELHRCRELISLGDPSKRHTVLQLTEQQKERLRSLRARLKTLRAGKLWASAARVREQISAVYHGGEDVELS